MIYDFRMRRPLPTLAPLALVVLAAGCRSVPRETVLRAQDLRAEASPDLEAAAKSGSTGERRRAILAMARVQSPAYEETLARLARKGPASVRREAVFALGQLGFAETPEAPRARAALEASKSRAATALRPLLAERSAPLRAAAYEALGKTGSALDEPALAAGLRDQDPKVRGEAALALFRLRLQGAIPSFSTGSLTALRGAFADPRPSVRRAAVYPFSRYAEPSLAQPLSAECGPTETDRWARLFACRALGLIGRTAPAEELVRTMSGRDALLRYEAVRSLGLAGRAELLTPAVLTDSDAPVRAAAADALAASGDATLAGRLDAVEDAGSALARAAVTAAYAKLGPRERALRRLGEDRKDARWWVRAQAYKTYGELDAGTAAWTWAQRDADPRVAAAQLETLFGAAVSRSTRTAAALLVEVLADTAAPVELVGTAVDLAPKAPSASLLPGLKAVRESALGARYPEVGDAAVEAYNALASSFSADAPRLSPVPKTPSEPSPWLGTRLPATSVVLKTAKGEVEIALAVEEAPIHAAAFADSARRGVYDGLSWHRVVPGFVVQGGDPRGSGWGDCGFSLRDEINTLPFDRGVVGMPKAGKDTGGCQLFITLVPTPRLDGRYTAFGRVTRGLEVVDRLEPGDLIEKAWIAGGGRLSHRAP
jgi:cyclophilin family peptidyl-prolyl cis-trans isomerase/HEAT repeat protein